MQTYKTSKARENILRKIRIALQEEAVPMPFPETEKLAIPSFFNGPLGSTPEETFAVAFSNSGGHFVFCHNQDELLTNLKMLAESRGWTEVLCAHKSLFSFLVNNKISFVREFNPMHEQAQACITDCEAAIARTGSFLFSSKQNHGRVAPVYFPVHIVVLQPHQIVPDIADGLKLLKQKYNDQLPSMINLNTGPSRTADIEKTLVTGVHGPKEVFCFFLNQ
ncbi:LutC/YkgG family protein [Taibaiella helva]|uniref:LutC/YkgG family protein n=1 Tax=Taibaiella helva TaxID=2301235 RepID=UPI000E57A75E|nr:LUD domain-containing protein [Taibaiella helva]